MLSLTSTLLLVGAALLTPAAAAAPPGKAKLFVLDFTGDGVAAADIDAVEAEVARQLTAARRYDVVTVASSQPDVDIEEQRKASAALGAAVVVVGHVTRLTSSFAVELTLVGARSEDVVGTGSALGAKPRGLGREAASALLASLAPPPPPPGDDGGGPANPVVVVLGSATIALGLTGAVGLVPLVEYFGADERYDAAGARLEEGEDVIGELADARDQLVRYRNDWHDWGLALVVGGAAVVAGGVALVVAGATGAIEGPMLPSESATAE